MRRNVNEEVRAKVKAAIPEWEHVPAIVAQTVITDLEANDPELLADWLSLHATRLLTELVVELGARPVTNSKIVTRNRFAEAARRFEETGDVSYLQPFMGKRDADNPIPIHPDSTSQP